MNDPTISPTGGNAAAPIGSPPAAKPASDPDGHGGSVARDAPGGGPPADETPIGAGRADGGAFEGDPGMQAPVPAQKGGVHYWAKSNAPADAPAEQAAMPWLWDAVEFPADESRVYEKLGNQFEAAEIPPTVGKAAMKWLGYMAQADVSKVKPYHNFDFSRFARFTPDDQPYLDYFGNTLKAAGATQEHVDKLLTMYEEGQVRIAQQNLAAEKEADRLDREDAKRGQKALRAEWGAEYDRNVRLINQYISQLSRSERERLEKEEMPDGSLALNNPQKLMDLAKLARSGAKSPTAKRLTEIKAFMRTNRQAYLRDERLQVEYLDLLRAQEQ
jgi:hypothetical protein